MNTTNKKRIIFESNTVKYKDEISYSIRISNLLCTMGNTIGNVIRRLLITSIPGTSINGFKIAGIEHSFDYNNNIDKDADQIADAIRDIIIAYSPNALSKITTTIQGPKQVTAADLLPSIKVINSNLVIFNIVNAVSITTTLYLSQGYGFKPYYKQNLEDGIVPVTSIFTHNKNVTFDIVNNNIDDRYEDLIIKFDTYELFEDVNLPIKYALQYLSQLSSEILEAIDFGPESENILESSENMLSQQVEAIINQAQTELISYIYESNIDINDVEALIELLKEIPDKTCINKVKIKKKEIQNIIKQLSKLLKPKKTV